MNILINFPNYTTLQLVNSQIRTNPVLFNIADKQYLLLLYISNYLGRFLEISVGGTKQLTINETVIFLPELAFFSVEKCVAVSSSVHIRELSPLLSKSQKVRKHYL
jgi:hypothetical protein